MEVHKLRIDTLSEASLRGDVDDHDALESLGEFPEQLVEVPVYLAKLFEVATASPGLFRT